jgi:hypothetical protein
MNLRRVLAVLLAMMLSAFAASAQMVKASFGVTGGGMGTMLATDPTPVSPMFMSGYGGAFATINYGTNLGVRVGANYAMQGANYEVSNVPLKADQTYINVPVAFMYSPKSFFSLQAGFYQNILLSSTLTEQGNSEVVISPDEGALKYNFGVMGGMCFNFGRIVFLDLKYNYGLSNSYVIYGKGFPSSFVTVGLGFNIVTTRKTAF